MPVTLNVATTLGIRTSLSAGSGQQTSDQIGWIDTGFVQLHHSLQCLHRLWIDFFISGGSLQTHKTVNPYKPGVLFMGHIIIIIIISILKPVFLYRGLGLFDKSSSKTSSPLRTVHRISKIHSKLLSIIHQHFIPGFLRPAGSLLCNYI